MSVDAAVPLPAPFSGNRRYPWREMSVGDSFFVKADGYDVLLLQRRLSALAHGAVARIGDRRRYTTRVVRVGEIGVRVWRTE